MNYTSVGTLWEVLSEVAWRIQQQTNRQIQIAWTDDFGSVYVADAAAAPDVPSEQFVGAYTRITSIDDIIDDLRATMRERAGGAIASTGA